MCLPKLIGGRGNIARWVFESIQRVRNYLNRTSLVTDNQIYLGRTLFPLVEDIMLQSTRSLDEYSRDQGQYPDNK